MSQKTSPMFLAITRESIVRFSYLAEILLRKQEITRCYIFPPHLINASAQPRDTKHTEIVSLHINVEIQWRLLKTGKACDTAFE